MKGPRILHLASWYPSKSHPTLGNFVQRHIEVMAESSTSMVLFAAEYKTEELDFQSDPAPAHLIVYYKKRLPIISHYKALKKGYQLLMEKGYEFDLIHLHVTFPAGLLALALPQPYIITEHFSGYQKQRGYKWGFLKKLLARRIFNQAEVVCPVSAQLGHTLREFGVRSTLKVISNTVDTSVFYPAPELPRNPKFRFLHISSLQNSTKNISGILKAFAELSRLNPNIELAIGGDGDPSELIKEARDLGLDESSLEILPAMEPKTVARQMREANCFVLFSHIENQPVVLLEALCCGTPVIATNVGGIAEFVTPERGLLIEAGNTDSLVKAYQEMYEGFPINRAKVAAEMQELCSPQAVRQKYEEVYASALRSNS